MAQIDQDYEALEAEYESLMSKTLDLKYNLNQTSQKEENL